MVMFEEDDIGIGNENLVALRLRITNNRLAEARQQKNITLPDFAVSLGIRPGHYRDIENLRICPTEEEVLKIAVGLNESPETLFPDDLLDALKRKAFPDNRKRFLGQKEVKALPSHPDLLLLTDGGIQEVEDKVDNDLLRSQIDDVMSTMTHREQRVLELRFGLKDGRNRTLEEVGNEFNLTKESIRQIEYHALAYLRHPIRSRKLKQVTVLTEYCDIKKKAEGKPEKKAAPQVSVKSPPPIPEVKVKSLAHYWCEVCAENYGGSGKSEHYKSWHPEYKFHKEERRSSNPWFYHGREITHTNMYYLCDTCGKSVSGPKGAYEHYQKEHFKPDSKE